MTEKPVKIVNIDPLSTVSLFLQTTVLGQALSTATGFIVEKDSKFFLITNWHVVTGRNAETEQPLSSTAAIPDGISIIMHLKQTMGTWTFIQKSLIEPDGKPIWVEHPRGKEVDVVAIPLGDIPPLFKINPLDLNLAKVDMAARPSMPVSIIGYPFSIKTGGFWPIWKTGHIAMDPDIDHENKPAFLIDATTREGMSGSPVVLRLSGGFQQSNGTHVIAGGISTKFLGIYSGRLLKDQDTNLGLVWKPQVINEIIDQLHD